MKKRSKKKGPHRASQRRRRLRKTLQIRAWCGSGERIEALDSERLAAASYGSRRSAARWIRERRLPDAIQALLEHRILGLIDDPAFAGWHVRDGALIDPLGRAITPGGIEALQYTMELNRELQRHVRALEAQVRRLDAALEQWRIRSGELPAANDGPTGR